MTSSTNPKGKGARIIAVAVMSLAAFALGSLGIALIAVADPGGWAPWRVFLACFGSGIPVVLVFVACWGYDD